MRRALLLLPLLAGCAARVNGDAHKPAPPPDAGQELPRAHIDVELPDGRAFGVQVELALTDADRERGLMFRKSLAEGEGMLFIFPEAGPHNFWMKNTLIPLDMVFADDAGTVLGCVDRAEPMTLTSRGVPGDSKYVLEVPGGWCADHGVAAGAHLIPGEAARFKVE